MVFTKIFIYAVIQGLCITNLIGGEGKDVLAGRMSDAWNTLRQELFCEKTNMIYDSIGSRVHDKRFDHLPFINEIKAKLPNSLGWGTGMEDCMLNAGSAIDSCIIQAQLSPVRKKEYSDFARKLFEGMKACATVHGVKGYVVRGISPRDGKSCYPESSRDQFTLWTFGLWRYYHSTIVAEADKKEIRKLLTDLAELCESRMNHKYGHSLGKLDGSWSGICRMDMVNPHEMMRLPMFYIAAYDVSGNKHWLELYESQVGKALSQSEKYRKVEKVFLSDYEAMQMQISLFLCWSLDPSSARRETISGIMNYLAKTADSQFIRCHASGIYNYRGPWNVLSYAWRMSKQIKIMGAREDRSAIRNGGSIELLPSLDKNFHDIFTKLRGSGNIAITALLAPDYRVSDEFIKQFRRAAASIEYKGCTTAGIVNIIHAYCLVQIKSEEKK